MSSLSTAPLLHTDVAGPVTPATQHPQLRSHQGLTLRVDLSDLAPGDQSITISTCWTPLKLDWNCLRI